MLFEIYLALQIVGFLFLLIGWFTRNIVAWVISIVVFGIQMVTSFNIEFMVFVVNNSDITMQLFSTTSIMAYVNMLFFSVSLVYIFYDIFTGDDYLGGREK